MKKFSVSVLFGGTGFIGSHFARHLLVNGTSESVYLVDLNPPHFALWSPALQQAYHDGQVRYVQGDVRQPLLHADLPNRVDLIANFAAVHREPGACRARASRAAGPAARPSPAHSWAR